MTAFVKRVFIAEIGLDKYIRKLSWKFILESHLEELYCERRLENYLGNYIEELVWEIILESHLGILCLKTILGSSFEKPPWESSLGKLC